MQPAELSQQGDSENVILAIASIVLALVVPPVGVVLGHVALSRNRSGGGGGRALALTGLVLGYAGTALIAAIAIPLLL